MSSKTIQIGKKKNTKKLTPEDLRKMRDKDLRMVKGIFRCFEPVGGSFTFSFKKYKDVDTLTMTLNDGEQYELPLMVAKHLNQNCSYPVHSHVMDINGNPTVDVGRKVKRCSFESLEFIDMED